MVAAIIINIITESKRKELTKIKVETNKLEIKNLMRFDK